MVGDSSIACIPGQDLLSGSSCRIACAPGAALSSPTSAFSCLNAVLTSPSCKPLTCDIPLDVGYGVDAWDISQIDDPSELQAENANTKTVGNTVNYQFPLCVRGTTMQRNSSCHVACRAGYAYVGGSMDYVCLANNVMVPPTIRCMPSQCTLPATLPSGYRAFVSASNSLPCTGGLTLDLNTGCTVMCNLGLEVIGGEPTAASDTMTFTTSFGKAVPAGTYSCANNGSLMIPSLRCLSKEDTKAPTKAVRSAAPVCGLVCMRVRPCPLHRVAARNQAS